MNGFAGQFHWTNSYFFWLNILNFVQQNEFKLISSLNQHTDRRIRTANNCNNDWKTANDMIIKYDSPKKHKYSFQFTKCSFWFYSIRKVFLLVCCRKSIGMLSINRFSYPAKVSTRIVNLFESKCCERIDSPQQLSMVKGIDAVTSNSNNIMFTQILGFVKWARVHTCR